MGSNMVSIGNRGMQAQRRKIKEQEQKQKGDGWALSHPANGLLATLAEKGWPRRPFASASSRQFFTFWGKPAEIPSWDLLWSASIGTKQ